MKACVTMGKSLVLAVACATTAAHAADAPTTYLWDSGGQLSVARAGNWGNGVSKQSRAVNYNGDDVLQITTRNFSEGVIFDMAPAVDIDAYKKNGFLRLRLRFRDAPPPTAAPGTGTGTFDGTGGLGTGSPGLSSPGSGSSSLGSGSGGIRPSTRMNKQVVPRGGKGSGSTSLGATPLGGFGAPPIDGGGDPGLLLPVGPPPQETRIHRLQFSFMMEKGVASGAIDLPSDLEKIQPDDDGWRLFLMPVKDLRRTPNADGLVQRMLVTSDREDTFYLAQAALVVESGQIDVSIRRPADIRGAQVAELNVKPGLVTLVADVEAGTADPLIEWNFDADNVNPDLKPPGAALPGTQPGAPAGPDGFPTEGGVAPVLPAAPHADARGLVAKFEYPNEEQDYRVEVTVTDRAGKKAPAKSSILIHVRG